VGVCILLLLFLDIIMIIILQNKNLCTLNILIFDLAKVKVGPVGNRHVEDHIACNFHATHPYLIYVIGCADICDH